MRVVMAMIESQLDQSYTKSNGVMNNWMKMAYKEKVCLEKKVSKERGKGNLKRKKA